jgi:translin
MIKKHVPKKEIPKKIRSPRGPLIDKADFNKIQKEMEFFEKRREEVIKKSREIIKLSKQIIYGIHRDDKNIPRLITEIKGLVSKLRTRGELQYSSFYKTAMQEYVEAVAMYEVLKNHKLPSQHFLFVSAPDYLAGLCDLTGELMRKANNFVIKRQPEEAIMLKEVVDLIYGEFLALDIRDNDLRKKADQIKYNLRKLEDIAYHLARRRR